MLLGEARRASPGAIAHGAMVGMRIAVSRLGIGRDGGGERRDASEHEYLFHGTHNARIDVNDP
jgi:hypothetical protein